MNDDLTLEVGGRAITGWSKVKVTRSIEKLPSSFELSLMDRYPASGGQQWVNPGDPCVVKLGNDSVLNGYIDSWENAITATTHVVSAMGRGKCQDLVDCSAKWPNSVISQSTVLQIAQKLAEPYGITVTSDITDMTIVPTFTLNWGETAQTVIENVTRWAALLYYDQLDGNLLLTRVGNRKAASGVAQGVNILSASLHTDINKRFIDYTGVVLSTNAVALGGEQYLGTGQSTGYTTGGAVAGSLSQPHRYRRKHHGLTATGGNQYRLGNQPQRWSRQSPYGTGR
ncbi:putative bacteriophage tail protein [Yersinia pseudotuberculosis]|nr:putative bacteriophage tail protein [Yersinia pseudotuberculosis]